MVMDTTLKKWLHKKLHFWKLFEKWGKGLDGYWDPEVAPSPLRAPPMVGCEFLKDLQGRSCRMSKIKCQISWGQNIVSLLEIVGMKTFYFNFMLAVEISIPNSSEVKSLEWKKIGVAGWQQLQQEKFGMKSMRSMKSEKYEKWEVWKVKWNV